jgi:hypothetical protein
VSATDQWDTPGGLGSSSAIPCAYTRLYTDVDGHSRFEDVELAGETRGVGYAELVATFAQPIAAEAVVFRNVVREASDETPHNAPRRQFIIQVSGACEVESSTGEIRHFGPGSVLLVEDLHGHGHITRKVGTGERLTLLITLPDSD